MSNLMPKKIYIPPTPKKKGHYKTVMVRVEEMSRLDKLRARRGEDENGNIDVSRTDVGTNDKRESAIQGTVGSNVQDESRGFGTTNGGGGKSVRYASSNKQYEADGYKLGRWANTVIPTSDSIPESISQHLNQAQKDFINLGIENVEKGNKSILNFDGTGTGKTRQELGLAQTYLLKYPGSKVLIVTESDTIIDNAFVDDSNKMGLPITKITSKESKTDGIGITTYSMLDKVAKDYDLVIFDEAHNLKNSDSKKSIAGLELISSAKNTAIFTATPNDKAEHLHYITSALGLNFRDVMDQIGIEIQEMKGLDGTVKTISKPKVGLTNKDVISNIESFFNTVTDRGLAVKREVSLDNLKMSIETIDIPSELQGNIDKAYDEYIRSVESVENPFVRGRIKASGLLKMRTLLEGVKVNEAIERTIKSIANGEQVVIVGAKVNTTEVSFEGGENKFESVGTLQAISDGLEARGIKVVSYYGEDKDRAGVKKFQSSDAQVFITTPQSGGTGISLDDSKGGKPRRMILTSFPFSANAFVQVIGRINRKNTKSEAKVEALYVDHPIDNWNKSIIGTKVATLGASVSGDYARIDADTLSLVESVESMDIAQAITQNNSDLPSPIVETHEAKILNFDRMKKESNVVVEAKKGTVATFKSMSEYLRQIPVMAGGIPSTNFMWKDAKIQLGTEKVLISDLIRTKPDVAFYYIKRALPSRAQALIDSGQFTKDTLSKVRFAGSVTPKERVQTESLTKSFLNEGLAFLQDYLADENELFEILSKGINPNLVKRKVASKTGTQVFRWVNPTEDVSLPGGFKTAREQREASQKSNKPFFEKSSHFGNVPEVAQKHERKKLMELDKTINSGELSSEQKDQAIDQAKKYIEKINESHSEFKKKGFYISADLRFKIMRRPSEGKQIELSANSIDTLLKFGKIGIISAGKNPEDPKDMELTDTDIAKRDKALVKDLETMGFQYVKGMGKYGGLPEESYIFFIPEATKQEVSGLGTKYNQDSVIYTDEGKNEMIFTVGANKGLAYKGKSFDRVGEKQDDFFTEVKTAKKTYKFSLRFNFDTKE